MAKPILTKGSHYVTRWQPFECSLVTCAADPFNAGVGRSLNTDNEMIVLEGEQVEDEIKDTPVEEIKPEDEEKNVPKKRKRNRKMKKLIPILEIVLTVAKMWKTRKK
ncbi:hypothetical protein ACP0HM_05060 [Escherichia coli]